MPNARFSSEKVNPTAQITRAICKIVDRSGPHAESQYRGNEKQDPKPEIEIEFQGDGQFREKHEYGENDLEHA